MNNWIPKNKIVKFAITMASISVVLYFVGLLIVLDEVKKIENFYLDTESESFKKEKFQAIKSIADANKAPIQTLRNFFIQKDDEVKFIEQIEEAARTSSADFELISIDVKTNQEDFFKEDINVKMKITSSWRSIMYFINKLEKMPFGVSIEKINLDANIPGDWSGSIEFIIFREK